MFSGFPTHPESLSTLLGQPVSPTSGVIRRIQLGLPLSGAGMWRLSNFQF